MKLLNSKSRKLRANPSRAGWVQVGLMVLSIGLSYLAQQLLAKEPESPIDKDKPTTLATRGSLMNWLCGIRRIGPVFAWAGDRVIVEEESEGGKGGGDPPDTEIYYESGWHQLAVGPCDALHQIIQGGKSIFNSSITPTSHPSGSSISLGKEGHFVIYWGEPDQPINTFLGDSSRVGITSRWPHCCYIQWTSKRLSTSPTWPLLDYVIERRPSNSVLSGSDSWVEPSLILNGPTYRVSEFYTPSVIADADENVGQIILTGFTDATFLAGRTIRITGNGLPDGDYTLLSVAHFDPTLGVATAFLGGTFFNLTIIKLEGGTLGADANGSFQSYTEDLDAGANIAHAKAELLFAPWPLGLGLDTDGPEPWDIGSLELLGAESQANGWRASLISVNGEDVDSLLGNALQDHGVMVPIDTQTGKVKFSLVRPPAGVLPNIPEDLFVGQLPEVEVWHGDPHIDSLVFQFRDREFGFGNMTIVVDSDGNSSRADYKRANKVPIPSVTYFPTAASLAEARSQEELATGGEFRLSLSRAARKLLPGDAITADGFDEVLRVTEVEYDPLGERVNVNVITDFYGARRSDFVNQPGGGNPNFQSPQNDLAYAVLELPEALMSVIEQVALVPRIRAHAQIVSSAIHLSSDNVTYNLKLTQSGYATGGFLDAEFSSDSLTVLDTGPEFTVAGPDIAAAQDLSSDLSNWGLGRQLCVFVDPTGFVEIMFVQKLTATGGDTFRLDGLMRARYDTRKATFSAGTAIYVFSNTALREIYDPLLEPSNELFVKSQPLASSGPVLIGNVPQKSRLLRGKGVRPIELEDLRCTAPYLNSQCYGTGDDVTIRWSWSSASSKSTGAGLQSAGNATGLPVIAGNFNVRLMDATGVVLAQIDDVTTNSITYSNAVLAADPIFEGDFKVLVYQTANGFVTSFLELTVTKI